MQSISVISPVKVPEDIAQFHAETGCSFFYVYHHKFINNNFDKIQEFIAVAKQNNSKIFVNFKHNISEDDLVQIRLFINYLKSTDINGIFINSYAIIEAIKKERLPFEVVIDSYFDIHNIAGIEFLNKFLHIDGLILTEEIYLQNIVKIKKCTNLILAIDTDNLPWCIEELLKNNIINFVVIKGDFNNSVAILDAIKYIKNVINFPEEYKNKKLPFKHLRKGLYQTNHFTGEIMSSQGRDFKFSRHIQKYDWNYKSARLIKNIDFNSLKLPALSIRLSSVEQVKKLKSFIDKHCFNPVYSIEYGEIVSTYDLAKKSFTQVINYVKKFCRDYGIFFSLSTPKILIERDFDRVYDYTKHLCLSEPYPDSVIVNNIGYFWNFINDKELMHIPVEIGYGINLLNSMSIACLNNFHAINAVDISVVKDIELIKHTVKQITNIVSRRKLVIAGNIRIPCLGLCPMNKNSAIISRLSCKAPCQSGTYAICDPRLKKIYPFVVDGFCKMHMYQDKIMNLFSFIPEFQKIGINEFVIDLNNLNSKFVNILLTGFVNSIAGANNNGATDYDEYNLKNL